ncbi:MAG: hypothetical protein HY934_05175 [Candidatus Firestonebacteria bacterium]|nr:hypothetical protein [Candidatus Firestonebacteria bacterium]
MCLKTDGESAVSDFSKRLMCLDCNETQLLHEGKQLRCKNCGRIYPITIDVIRMLPKELEAKLYSET